MPFGHLRLVQSKPKNNSYLWKSDHYPAQPKHVGEQIEKHRFDLKMPAHECQKLLGVDKTSLTNCKAVKHKPRLEMRKKIARFFEYHQTPEYYGPFCRNAIAAA